MSGTSRIGLLLSLALKGLSAWGLTLLPDVDSVSSLWGLSHFLLATTRVGLPRKGLTRFLPEDPCEGLLMSLSGLLRKGLLSLLLGAPQVELLLSLSGLACKGLKSLLLVALRVGLLQSLSGLPRKGLPRFLLGL